MHLLQPLLGLQMGFSPASNIYTLKTQRVHVVYENHSFSRTHVLIWFEQNVPSIKLTLWPPGEADQLVKDGLSPKHNSMVSLRKSYVASLDAAVGEYWESRGESL